MQTESMFHHGDYQLTCGARLLASGRYLPTLVITKEVWPTRPRNIALQPGDFADEASAVEEAHLRGVEWIANYG